MPNYKLYYFPLRGRGESARLLFAYAGVEYEDIRIPFSEWPAKKDEMPYKQMPVLEVDGVKYAESNAITRYLAREFGLAGKTSAESLKADEFAEYFLDVMHKLPWLEKDEEKKKELLEKYFSETLPPMLKLIEENMQGIYYTGSEVTYADIRFYGGSEFLVKHRPDLFDQTPKLKALFDRIRETPNIAKYLASRPETDM